MEKAIPIICVLLLVAFLCIPPATVEFNGTYGAQDQDGNVTQVSYEGVIHRYKQTITVGEDVYTYTLKDKVLTVTYPDGVVCTTKNFGSDWETGTRGNVDESRYIPYLTLYSHLSDLYN